MSTVLSSFLTVLFVMPFIGSILLFLIIKLVSKNTPKSIHKAVDYTTILYIISVHFLIISIWGKSLLWIIILLMILIAMMFVVVHWRVKGEIDLKKVMKGFWRFNFIVFFISYFSLIFYGLFYQAITFTFSS